MNDRSVGLLDQYELELGRTAKGRGAFLCETDKGLLVFKEYFGNPEHLKVQQEFLDMVQETGGVRAEQLLQNKEGELFVTDRDGVRYILKTFSPGRECNIREREECREAAACLARLHRCNRPGVLLGSPVYSIGGEYEKRTRELKKIRKYLRHKSQKTWFEIALNGCFDQFYQQALEVGGEWMEHSRASSEEKAFCHGDYQYHNLLCDESGWFIINFDRCVVDDPVRDLHLLLRKLLEKNDWSVSLGRELLEAYEKERPLSEMSRSDLFYRLSFPEKFWKIANFYYNSGKAWIPGRNGEKLELLLSQETKKKAFLKEVFQR